MCNLSFLGNYGCVLKGMTVDMTEGSFPKEPSHLLSHLPPLIPFIPISFFSIPLYFLLFFIREISSQVRGNGRAMYKRNFQKANTSRLCSSPFCGGDPFFDSGFLGDGSCTISLFFDASLQPPVVYQNVAQAFKQFFPARVPSAGARNLLGRDSVVKKRKDGRDSLQ